MQGEVNINGVTATSGMLVRPGDTVTTGARSLAAFVIGDDAYLLRDNSRVEFAGGSVVDTLRLAAGKLLGVFASGRGRRIVTSTSTIGIRGTGAYLEAESDRTYFCLCYGTAEAAAAESNERINIATTHHDSPYYIYPGRRWRAFVPANAANHTDDELVMLEALVGRKPPQSFSDAAFVRDPYK